MPKLTEERKEELKNIIYREISDFVHDNDFDGLYHYYCQKLDDVETRAEIEPKNRTPEQQEEFMEYMFKKNCVGDCLGDMGKENDPKKLDFLKKFLVHCSAMEHTRLMEAGKTYDEVTTRLKNGEIKDADLINGEKKMTENMALMLTVHGTPSGRKMEQAKGISAALTQSLSRTSAYATIKPDADKMLDELLKTDTTYSKADVQKYAKIFSKQASFYIRDEGLSEKNISFEVNRKKNDYSFVRVPDGIIKLQTMSAQQLDAFGKETAQQRDAILKFEKASKGWGETAKKLLTEFENSLPKEQLDKMISEIRQSGPQKDPLKLFYYSLRNASKVGSEEFEFGNEYLATAKRLSFKTVGFTLDDVPKKAEAIKDINPELYKKVTEAVRNAGSNIETAYKAGADKVFDKYKDNPNHAQSKMLDCEIARIEKQQLKLAIAKENPQVYHNMNQRLNAIADLDVYQESIRQFTADTRDIIQVTFAVNNYFDKDKKTRDLTNGKHEKYANMVNAVSELNSLNSKNLSSLTYKDIMNKLKLARDASEEYLQSHRGFVSIVSGWSNDGRSRLASAKYIKEKLDRQIAEMTDKYDKMMNMDNLSLDEKEHTVIDTKTNLRKENAEERKNVIKRLDNKLFDNSYSSAIRSINVAMADAGINSSPDKSKLSDHVAMMLAVETARAQMKNGNYGTNARKLNILKNNIKNSPEFEQMMTSYDIKELYNAAVSKKPGALSDLFNKKKPEPEKAKSTAMKI